MKKVISMMAIAAFLFSANVNAHNDGPKDKKKDAKTEKTCSAAEKKSCSADKKSCCAAKKAEEKK